ncbi:hypothetical protein BCR41DRAFT_347707 [Lobosporangium transversale]|uniref:Uncharacterized protein n=1 Tax=Lobosporangium transversale TaxID=64571 RepID=A0A1Y2GY06_9FUNG|nr:hypothetical protein BCR41DRAFT_347707 [Lobosporangium transversale]ORZ26651.1 hypothetical protein BCR41DRAFT_347707 [Lobosporangium transversale]|eukprot:XP_021884414.1 hypothetical protein BCR41DRAFT_347707 [Lobosporangium transversale]
MTMSFCKLILQRMYLLDHINDNSNAIDYTESLDEQRHENMKTSFSPLSSQSRLLSPFMTSKENMHVIARVIADQICRGICLPETAALVLQALTSLHDQNRFQYMVNMPTRQPIMRMPVIDDRVTFGALCFQYLLQNILPLLHPIDSCSDISSISSMAKTLSAELMKGTHEGTSWTQLQSHIPRSQLSIPTIATATISSLSSPPSSMSSPLSKPLPTSQLKDLTGNILVSQQEKLLPIHIRSVAHLTRILCFLPLVGWHFQCLSSNTFVDMFLDRSKGDLSIDRVAVMVYGFMCVRDLETGRVDPNDLESLRSSGSCYWIIEQSIPTLNEVQAREIVRIVGRHRKLMQRLLFLQYDHLYHQHAYNSFDASEISSRIFQQDASSMSLVS